MIESVSFHVRLSRDQYRVLLEESLRSGLPMAEIMRRAFDEKCRPSLRPVVKGWNIDFGVYRSPDAAVIGRLTRHPRRVRD